MSRLALIAVLSLCVVPGCVLGTEQDPGCRTDGECERGFVCRAGACLRYSTEAGPPTDPALPDASADAVADAPVEASGDAGQD